VHDCPTRVSHPFPGLYLTASSLRLSRWRVLPSPISWATGQFAEVWTDLATVDLTISAARPSRWSLAGPSALDPPISRPIIARSDVQYARQPRRQLYVQGSYRWISQPFYWNRSAKIWISHQPLIITVYLNFIQLISPQPSQTIRVSPNATSITACVC
jgi:hypothetical protein